MNNIEKQEIKIGLEHIRKVYPEKKKRGSVEESESCSKTFRWI